MHLQWKSTIAVFFSCLLFLSTAAAATNEDFRCGGKVEQQVWEEWDANMRDHLFQSLWKERLLKRGDTYALYDFQLYVHDLVAMARRCKRAERMAGIARLIRVAYEALEPGTLFSPGQRWICRRGNRCSSDANLRDKESEVLLYSVQFLGLASSVANALASSGAPLGKEERTFIDETVRIAIEHLLRWGDDEIGKIRKVMDAKPSDVKDGSSTLFFTDKPLWTITIHAELAGVLEADKRHGGKFVDVSASTRKRLRPYLQVLLEFFAARVTVQRSSSNRLKGEPLADLDRGYWRLYPPNRYAGYEKDEKPVICVRTETDDPKWTMEVRVPPEAVPVREDTGWDISHARRLVPALDALERNRAAMQSVFGLKDAQLPSKFLPQAFANTLVAVMWNGDRAKPLFSNYWSGANGWYRVAFRSSGEKCNEGMPPYFMTGAFPTGGYIAWARHVPLIGELGKVIYTAMNERDADSAAFIERYYPSLAKSKQGNKEAISRFMFMSSLVGSVR